MDLEKELKNERQLLQSNSKEFQCKSDEIDELLSKHNLATETITKLQTEKSDLAAEFESYKKETKEKMEQIEEYERKTRDALDMVEAKESSVEDMKKLVEEAKAA